MATFRVIVTATATTTYSVEVEAKNEAEAERAACDSNIYAVASDSEFGVAHNNCSFEAAAEQLTEECPECGVTHGYHLGDAWAQDYAYCIACGLKLEAEDAKAVSRVIQ